MTDDERGPVRRAILAALAGLLLIVGGFAATVAILNATVYSAAGFARSYLDALARQDPAGALEFSDTMLMPNASNELLARDGMPGLSDIALVSDTARPDGTHRVVFSWSSQGEQGTTTFDVVRTGTRLGLFATWRFDQSPLGWLDLTVLHDDRFAVNGLELQTPAQNAAAPYLAFTPGTYVLSHDTRYLAAEPVTIVAEKLTTPDDGYSATLDIQAAPAFLTAVQEAVDASLDTCATQEVLMPTGCPFGQSMANRVASTPEWSIIAYPEVAVTPGLRASEWQMPTTTGTAHLRVDVRSLFDGSVSLFDEDVPFRVGYLVTLQPDDSILLSPQYE